jgi:hypothetical protein
VVLEFVGRGLEEESCTSQYSSWWCAARLAYWGDSRLAWRHVAAAAALDG